MQHEIKNKQLKQVEFTRKKDTLSMVCTVRTKIQASPATIWRLLTDANGFPRWNSTVTAIDGEIREGEKIRIHVPGTNRTFKPMISDVVLNRRMTWSNGLALLFKGSRIFELRPAADGSTEFIMEEKFQGILFALVKNKLPDFRFIFERYALDLKKAAESRSV
jgi:hypothetical protein